MLTYNEGRAVMSRVPEHLGVALYEVRKHCWHKSHVYELPAVAWRRILDGLRAVAYGSRGGRAQRTVSLYTAIAKITDAVRTRELHPAFVEGRGVVGYSTEFVPAFIGEGGGMSPYPPGRFVILCPSHVTERQHTLTTWRPGDWSPSEEPLHSESFHLRFF